MFQDRQPNPPGRKFHQDEENLDPSQRTTVHTVGHVGKDGLGMHQVGAAKVGQTALIGGLSTSIAPHRLTELYSSGLGQQLSVNRLGSPLCQPAGNSIV